MLRSISRAGALALTGFLLIPPAAGSATLPSRKDTWLRVETAHFTLYGDARESKIKEVGQELERLRAVLLLLRQSLTASDTVPTSVFVFKSDAALESYKPLFRGKPSRASGFFQGSREGNFIALAAGWNTDPRPIIFHEYLHYFLHSNFPPRPTWYDEGVADFYSTFFATETEARIGLPVESHVLQLRGQPLLPLEKLFAIRHDSPEYNEESRQHLFYAQSWALVHYLMSGEPRRSGQLGRFLVLLQQAGNRRRRFAKRSRPTPTDFFASCRATCGEAASTTAGFGSRSRSCRRRCEPSGSNTRRPCFISAICWPIPRRIGWATPKRTSRRFSSRHRRTRRL